MSKQYYKPQDKVGSWTLIKRVEDFDGAQDLRAMWLCRCSCGMEQKVVARYLQRGDSKACVGCTPKQFTPTVNQVRQELTQERERRGSAEKALGFYASEDHEAICVDLFARGKKAREHFKRYVNNKENENV